MNVNLTWEQSLSAIESLVDAGQLQPHQLPGIFKMVRTLAYQKQDQPDSALASASAPTYTTQIPAKATTPQAPKKATSKKSSKKTSQKKAMEPALI